MSTPRPASVPCWTLWQHHIVALWEDRSHCQHMGLLLCPCHTQGSAESSLLCSGSGYDAVRSTQGERAEHRCCGVCDPLCHTRAACRLAQWNSDSHTVSSAVASSLSVCFSPVLCESGPLTGFLVSCIVTSHIPVSHRLVSFPSRLQSPGCLSPRV